MWLCTTPGLLSGRCQYYRRNTSKFYSSGPVQILQENCSVCCITTLYVSDFVRRRLFQVHVRVKVKHFITVMSVFVVHPVTSNLYDCRVMHELLRLLAQQKFVWGIFLRSYCSLYETWDFPVMKYRLWSWNYSAMYSCILLLLFQRNLLPASSTPKMEATDFSGM